MQRMKRFSQQGQCQGCKHGTLISVFQEGNFTVVIVSVDCVLSGECIGRSHVDSPLYPPFDVIFL